MNCHSSAFVLSFIVCALGLNDSTFASISGPTAPIAPAVAMTCGPQPAVWILATAPQGARKDNDQRLSPRTWGKIIRVGILFVVLAGSGAWWLFNKLKAQ